MILDNSDPSGHASGYMAFCFNNPIISMHCLDIESGSLHALITWAMTRSFTSTLFHRRGANYLVTPRLEGQRSLERGHHRSGLLVRRGSGRFLMHRQQAGTSASSPPSMLYTCHCILADVSLLPFSSYSGFRPYPILL